MARSRNPRARARKLKQKRSVAKVKAAARDQAIAFSLPIFSIPGSPGILYRPSPSPAVKATSLRIVPEEAFPVDFDGRNFPENIFSRRSKGRRRRGKPSLVVRKLPMEIRLNIYQSAIEENFIDLARHAQDARRGIVAEPAILRVCRTFREEAMKLYGKYLAEEATKASAAEAAKKAEDDRKRAEFWSNQPGPVLVDTEGCHLITTMLASEQIRRWEERNGIRVRAEPEGDRAKNFATREGILREELHRMRRLGYAAPE